MGIQQKRSCANTRYAFFDDHPQSTGSDSSRFRSFHPLHIQRGGKSAFAKPAFGARLFLATLLLSLVPLAKAATVYSCRGDHGEPVFSSTNTTYHDCRAVGEVSGAPQPAKVNAEPDWVRRAKAQSDALRANTLPPAPSLPGVKPVNNGGRIVVGEEIKLPAGQSAQPNADTAKSAPSAQTVGGTIANDGRMAIYKVKLPNGQTEYSNLQDEAERGQSSVVATYFPLCFACDSAVDWNTVPLHLSEYEVPIEQAVLETGISESMLRAVLHAESDFNIHARSSSGGEGIALLGSDTAMSLGVSDRSDPSQAILAAARRLVWLRDRLHGQRDLKLAAYNRPVEVIAAHGLLPDDPQLNAFVRSVVILQPRYEKVLPSRPFIPRKIIVVGGKVVNKGPGVIVGNTFLTIRPAPASTSPTH